MIKKVLIVLCFLSVCSIGWTRNYCNDSAAVGCWLFTEGSGTTVADSTANTNTGNFKASGEPAWNTTDVNFAVSGSAPNSVDFDAVNDYITITAHASINQINTFTWTFWFIEDGTGENNSGRIYDRGSGYKNSFLIDHLNKIQAGVDFDTTDAVSITEAIYTNSTWTHCAITFDNTGDKKIRIYVNGVEEDAYGTQTAGVGTVVDDSAVDLYLGNNDTSGIRTLNGKITDVGFFSRVLTVGEINEIYKTGLTGSRRPMAVN